MASASFPEPKPVSAEEKLREMDSVPLFMRSLPEDGADNVAINALQSLAHEGTPDEIAENFKDQGNNYFKGKRFKEAREFYTQGIEVKPTNATILEALYCNRAACNLEFKNYGFVLRDCSKAISLNPRSSKAHYRSAFALFALERFDESLDCCNRCLEFDPDNAAVQQLRDRARIKLEAKEKKEKEKQEKLKQEAVAKRELRQALQARNIVEVNDPNSESSPYEPYLEKEDASLPPSLVLPVFFLYPQHATSDLISHFHEDVPFTSHLQDMFPSSISDQSHPPPEWDKNREYLAPNLVVYAFTHTKRLLKVGKKMTLRELFDASKGKNGQKDGLEMKNGCLTVVVLPKGEVERRWIDDFKAKR